MVSTDNRSVLSGLSEVQNAVTSSWPDEYGRGYAGWIGQIQDSLSSLEGKREEIMKKAQEIVQICEELIESGEGIKRKIKCR